VTNQIKAWSFFLLGAMAFPSSIRAATVSSTTFEQVAESQGAPSIRFDDYVSNPQPGGWTANNRVFLTTPGIFTGFTNPTSTYTTSSLLPDPVGILVENSFGSVRFMDATSYRITSDILGPMTTGGTLTFTFVDPSNPVTRATVEQIAFRFGSVLSPQAVVASFFDVDMNEISVDNAGDETVPSGWASSRGWTSADGSVIHKVQFTATSENRGDDWFVGSFYDSQALPDMAFTGFELYDDHLVSGSVILAPLPAAAWTGFSLLGGLFVSQAARRKRPSP